MTIQTCLTCGHSGEHITDTRGFCTACGYAPAKNANATPPVEASASPGDGAANTSKKQMSLGASLGTTAIGTILYWGFLFCVHFIIMLLATMFSFLAKDEAAIRAFNDTFTTGLLLGGGVGTCIGWYLAYRRHPFLGAMFGISAGMLVSFAYWIFW